jgi:hypothetical protein
MLAELSPAPLEAAGHVASIFVVGFVAGYVAGALAEYLAPQRGIRPLVWAEHGGAWVAFGAVVFVLFRWLGVS